MNQKRQQGFGYIAAIVVVVILAALASAAIRLNTTQQASADQDVLSARALQTARAGTEWGLYRALNGGACTTTTLDFIPQNGFRVTVVCSSFVVREGQFPDPDNAGVLLPRSKTIYTIEATSCNSTACPNPAQMNTLYYTERRRVVTACSLNDKTGAPTGEAC